jgi:cobalt-precorrin 5A hydrolase
MAESEGDSLAIIAASRDGARLAARLARICPQAEVYVLERYWNEAGPRASPLDAPLGPAVGGLFHRCSGLVFFLPVGAVVRLIAPYIRDKQTDPAVVAVDDRGHFAVSVLSGHAGGANDLASWIALRLGAQAVITTAVERSGLPALESLGNRFGWRLEASREALLRLSAALVNETPFVAYQDLGLPNVLPLEIHRRRLKSLARLIESDYPTGLAITMRNLPKVAAGRYVIWRPRHLVAGVGCSSGASADEVESLLRSALAECDCALGSVGTIATLDRKLQEPGVVELAARLQANLVGYSAAELAQIAVPSPSEEVRQAVGTPSVAEAAALRAATATRPLVPKRTSPRATVAIALDTTAGVRPFRHWEKRLHPEWFPDS